MKINKENSILVLLADTAKPNRFDYLILFIFTIFLNYFWLQNVYYYVIDGTPLVAIINYYKDKSLYENALSINSLEHYYTYYFYIAGLIGKYFSTKTVISIMSLIPGMTIVPVVFMLGYTLFSNKYIGYLTVLLTLTHWQGRVSLGGGDGFGNVISHFSFAAPFLLLSLVLFIRKHYVTAFLIAGVMFNIHAPLAVSTIFILLVCAIWSREISIKRIIVLLLLSMGASVPTLIWYTKSLATLTIAAQKNVGEWMLLNRLRNVHSLPFSWNIGIYIRFLAYVINIVFLIKLKRNMRGDIYKNVMAIITAILILSLVGTIFVELYNVEFITKLSLLRSTVFLIYLSSAILAAYCVTKIDEGALKEPETILAGLVILSLITWNIKIAIAFEVLLFGRLWLKQRVGEYLLALGAIVTICVIGLYYVSGKYIYPVIDNVWPMVFTAFILSILLISTIKLQEKRKSIIYVGMALVVLTLGMLGFYNSNSEDQKEYIKAEWSAQKWLSENTPNHIKLLIPPYLTMWENYSMRDSFFTYNDLAYVFYGTDLMPEVMGRLNEYVSDLSSIKNSGELYAKMIAEYNSWDENKIGALANKYNIGYFITDTDKNYYFPLVYQNSRFRIYKIQSL